MENTINLKIGAIYKKNRDTFTSEEQCYISLYNSSIFHAYEGLDAFTTEGLMQHPLYAVIKDLFKASLTNNCLNLIKNMFLPDNNYTTALKSLDSHLPCIAFVRFSDSEFNKGRGYKPFELYELIFIKKFYGVKMFQSYIYSTGDDMLSPSHSTIYAEYKQTLKKNNNAI